MTDPDPLEAMRAVARELLREVVPEMLAEAGSRSRENGHGAHVAPNAPAPQVPPPPVAGAATAPVPQVPPPPVAAVLRPSTWTGPAVSGEVIGDGAPGDPEGTVMRVDNRIGTQLASPPATSATDPGARIEAVSLDTDEDLERFVRTLLARLESPRERRDIRAGRLRFTLRRAPTAPTARTAPAAPATAAAPTTTLRIATGAVTERAVRDAAKRGLRIVLARGAVLTPLARDQARALGVEIEKEGRC